MSDTASTPPHNTTATTPVKGTPPSEAVLQARQLLHDMNNGLEIIIQAAYLVGTLELSEDGKQWMKLLEHGVTQVTNLNSQLRDLIRNQKLI